MNLRRLMLGMAALVTLGSTSALAAPPDVTHRQMQLKDTLTVFDLGLTQDRVQENIRGRRDVVFTSNQSRDQVLTRLKNAYSDEKQLPNGYKVAGWAHMVKTDSTTFTLKNAQGDRMVAEVFDEGGRARVKVWGVVRTANPPLKPFNQVPHRFSPIQR